MCSDYYFGICKGWCNQQTMKKEKLTSTEYKKIIKLIISFFKGNTLLVEKEIKSLIAKSIREENFERAAKLRDIYMHIQELVERQTVVIQKPIT
ncbi:UvrB/UvrC motif-containing protein [Patescibacteria group bacterium]|nr:UvrB/UvrC motif-containing protein [Patescibacteria group bacterium]MBU1758514.1 UvrB/UvrC motif-containing protein [Patescibacteria group bacterium]